LPDLVGAMTTEEALDYIKSVHAGIDENWMQSDNLKALYNNFTKTLNLLVLEKIKAENVE